jgi:hypothetical protein
MIGAKQEIIKLQAENKRLQHLLQKALEELIRLHNEKENQMQ